MDYFGILRTTSPRLLAALRDEGILQVLVPPKGSQSALFVYLELLRTAERDQELVVHECVTKTLVTHICD